MCDEDVDMEALDEEIDAMANDLHKQAVEPAGGRFDVVSPTHGADREPYVAIAKRTLKQAQLKVKKHKTEAKCG